MTYDYRSYTEKLKDPRWIALTKRVFARDNHTCQFCGITEGTWQAHHLRYKFNCDPWDYELEDLTTLCTPCHEAESALQKAVKDMKLKFKTAGLSDQTLGSLLSSMPKRYYTQMGLTIFMLDWTRNIAELEGTPR